MKSSRLPGWALCVVIMIGLPMQTAGAERYVIREVMSGLVAPRGMAFGLDGGVYVAEAGIGGNGPMTPRGDGVETFFGTSSGLSRLLGGVQERVLEGLPSLARADGTEATGLNEVLFDGAGQAFGVFGLGGSAAARDSNLGAEGALLGQLVRLPLDGAGQIEPVADVAGYEVTANPDGGAIDSNPFEMALSPAGDLLIADAGANAFLQVTAAGSISTLGVLPAMPNPLPFGPPVYQSVPTSIAIGPDDAYYIGQLTGFPFPPGAANVYRFDPATSDLTVAHSGFTNIVDLTFDNDGNLYVLQITSNGLASAMGPGPGVLIKIDAATGDRTTIASEGLMFPGSVLAADDGTLYVTNLAVSPAGQVLSLTLVPEPSSLLLALVCLGAGMGGARIRNVNRE